MVFANGVEESEEKVTLTFWHTDADTRIVEPLEHLLAEFEARNPDIEVELTAWPADSYWQKYTTAISTGTSPDIFSTRDTELTQLIGMNAIMPLDGYISKWSNASQIPESIWTTLKMFSDKQNIFIIPTYANICCNWYNLNRLSMQGVDVPTTQKQFIEYCEKFADPVHGEYFYTLRGGAGSYDNMFIYVLSHAGAGSFFDENGNCVLSTDACIEGLEEYVSIYHNG